MLRVTVELIPHGNETRKRQLAMMEIINDGSGSVDIGNYRGILHAEYTGPEGRQGKVTDFYRQRQSVWSLVGAFLKLFGHTRHPLKSMSK